MLATPSTLRFKLLVALGAMSLLVALMSIVDMFVAKPYDGIIAAPTRESGIRVRDVQPGSGAARAGIGPQDLVLGIGSQIVSQPSDAAAELLRHEIGERVRYLVKRSDERIDEREVILQPVLLLDYSYVYYSVLGFLFFFIGLFVFLKKPAESVAQVFFLLCLLFMLFLICRLRPASYYWVDYFVQNTGSVSLFLLPAVFLHFFLIFPSRKTLGISLRPRGGVWGTALEPLLWLGNYLLDARVVYFFIYAIPPVAYLGYRHYLGHSHSIVAAAGAPLISWVLLGDYLILGLFALAHSAWRAKTRVRRRQVLEVLIGTILGIAPLVATGVFAPSLLRDDRYRFFAIAPLILVPVTFAYAIVRYQFLNIQVIFKKSLLYTLLTAALTGVYALAFASLNRLFSGFLVQESPIAPFVMALAIVLAIDPIRRRLQGPIDRLFFRERYDYQKAVLAMSESLLGELDLRRIVAGLTGQLDAVLKIKGSLLYVLDERSDTLRFAAASASGARGLDALVWSEDDPEVAFLRASSRPHRLASLRALPMAQRVVETGRLERLDEAGIELLVPFVHRGRLTAILLLAGRESEEPYSKEDLELIQALANQGAIALENAKLHEQLTRQVELKRELEIARTIQMGLFPKTLPRLRGFEVFGRNVPAREVGGDFYDFIEVGVDGDGSCERLGIVMGDVASKSVPAALLMVASKEIIFAKAQENPAPAYICRESNKRIYVIKNRLFVALSYFLLDCRTSRLTYALAGLPAPILVQAGSSARKCLEVPHYRLPLGALKDIPYDEKSYLMEPGELLVFYTDGVTEAMDTDGEFYGEERLQHFLETRRAEPLDRLSALLLDDIQTFTRGREQYDDITLLLLRAADA